MGVDSESNLFSMDQGCPTHGDEHMRECSMCGAEFCRLCFPRSAVCSDCADEADTDTEEGADFDDVKNLDEVLDDDEEAEKLVSEEDGAAEDVAEEDEDRF